MQVVHSSKNKFLREIFQVETTTASLGRGTIRHLGADQAYKVGLLAVGTGKQLISPPFHKALAVLDLLFLLHCLCKSLSLSFYSFLQRSLQEKSWPGVHAVNKCNVSPVSWSHCPAYCCNFSSPSRPRSFVTKFMMANYHRIICA